MQTAIPASWTCELNIITFRMETVTIPETSMVIHAQAAAPLKVSYQYKSLPPYGWIRVLVLHPGSFDDVLFCSLSARKIDEAGVAQYEALSYVWGRNERLADASHIECNDQIIGIGENLACALRHIRRKDETKYLWVDAICIDQGNLEERAEQVSAAARLSLGILFAVPQDIEGHIS